MMKNEISDGWLTTDGSNAGCPTIPLENTNSTIPPINTSQRIKFIMNIEPDINY